MNLTLIRLLQWIVAPAIFLLGSAGCGVQNIPVDPGFWKQQRTTIGIAIAATPSAGAHRTGAQGLLDVAINSAVAAPLDKHLAALAPTKFSFAIQRFQQRLHALGFTTKPIGVPIDLSKLPKRKQPPSGVFERDVQELARHHGVDALLVLSVERWGALRNYYGFIPMGSPSALFQARGQLIAADGRLRWQIQIAEEASILAVPGEWDQEPNFPNLTRAIELAQVKAVRLLETSFFDAAPASVPPRPTEERSAPPPASSPQPRGPSALVTPRSDDSPRESFSSGHAQGERRRSPRRERAYSVSAITVQPG